MQTLTMLYEELLNKEQKIQTQAVMALKVVSTRTDKKVGWKISVVVFKS